VLDAAGENQVLDAFLKVSELTESATRRLRVKSALNPILWLCAIVSPLCFATAYAFLGVEPICTALVIFGCFPPLVACVTFVGFAIYRPEKLQSEEYQIRHESLQLIQQKSGRLTVVPTSIAAIANPTHPLLLPGDNGNA
jgi:hypothetical protein